MKFFMLFKTITKFITASAGIIVPKNIWCFACSSIVLINSSNNKPKEIPVGTIRIMVSALAIIHLGDCLTEPLSFFCANKIGNGPPSIVSRQKCKKYVI